MKAFLFLILLASAAFAQGPITINQTQVQGGTVNDCLKVNSNRTLGQQTCSSGGGGVDTVSAGTGISVNQTTGNVIVTNTAPGASPVGSLGACQDYATSTTFGGDATICQLVLSAVSTPTAPVVTKACTPGGGETCMTTWGYKLVAVNNVGKTVGSAEGTIALAADTLNNTNKNTIATIAGTGIVSYEVCRSSAGGAPSGEGRIGTVTAGSSFVDTGQDVEDQTSAPCAPGSNTTVGEALLQNFRVAGRIGFGTEGYPNQDDYYGQTNNVISLKQTFTDFTGSRPAGVMTWVIADPSADTSSYLNGWSVYSQSQPGNTHALGQLQSIYGENDHDSDGLLALAYPFASQTTLSGGGNLTLGAGYWVYTPQVFGSGEIITYVAYYSQDLAGSATNIYYSWDDSRGVRRRKEDNTFNSVGQSIEALYNPQFTKYTPGAANYERGVLGQWESDVFFITTENGGMGVLRNIAIDGAEVDLGSATHLVKIQATTFKLGTLTCAVVSTVLTCT